MKESYEINNSTLALIALDNKTKVIEEEREFFIDKTPSNILEESCEYFGSSYLGRKIGTKNLIGITHKSPIIIEESREIIFFPTSSPRLNNCSWISLNNIKNFIKNNEKTKIIFENQKEIIVDVSFGIMENQILRASLLESTLRKRKKINNIV
ncbi:MAG TPA: competence protein ComK [Bacilli bacterium]|jgi:comK protein|nr:competence protein ComK [Bacilli bacterium]